MLFGAPFSSMMLASGRGLPILARRESLRHKSSGIDRSGQVQHDKRPNSPTEAYFNEEGVTVVSGRMWILFPSEAEICLWLQACRNRRRYQQAGNVNSPIDENKGLGGGWIWRIWQSLSQIFFLADMVIFGDAKRDPPPTPHPPPNG